MAANDAGTYVAGVPTWWVAVHMPAQAKKSLDYLQTLISPAAWEAHPLNGLLLYGPPGTGKTSVGCALLYQWGKAGHAARFQDFGELMVRIRSAWRKDAAQTTEQIYAEIMRPKILLLDDVGKRAAPEDQEALSVLVNGRVNRGKPTLLTTNCDLNTPQGRAEFVAAADSRVLERYRRCDVEISGDNLRKLA